MKKIAVNTVKNSSKRISVKILLPRLLEVGDNTFDVTFRTALSVMEKSVFLNRVVLDAYE